jgi:hypothetical protein
MKMEAVYSSKSQTYTEVHVATSQMAVLLIVIAVKTSNSSLFVIDYLLTKLLVLD